MTDTIEENFLVSGGEKCLENKEACALLQVYEIILFFAEQNLHNPELTLLKIQLVSPFNRVQKVKPLCGEKNWAQNTYSLIYKVHLLN